MLKLSYWILSLAVIKNKIPKPCVITYFLEAQEFRELR